MSEDKFMRELLNSRCWLSRKAICPLAQLLPLLVKS